jgi:hypothetical protein
MRDIDSSITAELSASQLSPFHLLDFTIGDTTYRYTDFQVDLLIDSLAPNDMYESHSWEFGGANYSVGTIVDDSSIKLLNINQQFTSLFIEQDIQGSECNIWGGVMDIDGVIIGVYKIFSGEIDEWTVDEEELNFTVISELYQWTQTTTKKHSSSCRWRKFKGLECQYSGADIECDRSYSRCSSLANTDNFGGFRWLPEIEDKEIWWGRKQLRRG